MVSELNEQAYEVNRKISHKNSVRKQTILS